MTLVDTKAWADAYVMAQQDRELLKQGAAHPLWWAIEKATYATREASVDALWQFILAVIAKSPPEDVIAVLAAGPLEELIVHAGPELIERIEIEARRSPAFRHVLGGVWRSTTHDNVWRRVEAARGQPW